MIVLTRTKIDYRARDLLKELLRAIGIPFHEAPGEAEAECARLQVLGIVDAVWSQDSDCLMFGCTLWLRDDRDVKEKGSKDRSKENTAKNKKYVKVVKAEDLKTHLQLGRDELVLFAMLVGGDYDKKGLPGCGPSLAMRVIKKGLARGLSLCRSQRDCDIWSLQLDDVLRTSGGRGVTLPPGFPVYKTLVKYSSPKVTNDETLRNHSRLNLDYVRPIDELKLLEMTSSRFNIWGRKYMDWVGPVLLTRYMSSRNASLPHEVVHDIKLVRTRAKKANDGLLTRVLERKLTFSPFEVTALQRNDFEVEREGYWNGERTTPFDPNHRVGAEMPEYWLRKVLPADFLDPPLPEPKTKPAEWKKVQDCGEQTAAPAVAKRKRKGLKEPTIADGGLDKASSIPPVSSAPDTCPYTTPMKRRQKVSTKQIMDIIGLSDSEDELRLPLTRPALPSSAPSATSQIVDFGSPSASEDDPNISQTIGTGSHRFMATPTRSSAHHKAIELDSDEDQDHDLQLALRLSVEEHVAPSSSSHKPGATAYPTKSPTSNPRKRTKQAFQPLNINELKSDPHVARQHTTQELLNSPKILSFTPARMVEVFPATEGVAIPGSESPLVDTGLSANEIRAARLRHFQQASALTPLLDMSPTVASTRTPNKESCPTFRVPLGADCIDLTED